VRTPALFFLKMLDLQWQMAPPSTENQRNAVSI
jgi:hypothetical protein